MAVVAPKLTSQFDFYSPFMSAAIIATDGTRYPLVTSPETTAVSPANVTGFSASGASGDLPSYFPYLSSVTVTLDTGYVPQINATLTPPYLDAVKLIEADVLTYGSAHLEVQFGYSAGKGTATSVAVSPVFKGLILKPDVSFGSDITIALNAQGTGGYKLATTGITGSTPQPVKVIDYMRSLCTKLSLTLDDSGTKADKDVQFLLNIEQAFTYGNESYFGVLYELARSCACYAYFEETKVRLVAMSEILKDDPVAELVLFNYDGGRIGPDVGRYPILSVNTDHQGIFLNPTVRSIIQAGIDAKTGEVKEQKVSPEKTEVATTGKGDVGFKDEQSGVSQARNPTPVDDKAQQQFKADYQAIMAQGNGTGIQLDIETLGIPDLVPGQVIRVTGVSPKRIDNLYSIQTVKHSLSSSGYSTSLTVIQNSTLIRDAVRGTFKSQNPNPNTLDRTVRDATLNTFGPTVPVTSSTQSGVP
jgi:hypothetical protein